MKKIEIQKSDKIQSEYSIKCPYCNENTKIIKGNSQNGVEANYRSHLWFMHKQEQRNE